jgi:kanamycin kinase
MKRQPVSIDPGTFPDTFHSLLADAPVFDSSCSPEARVYYIDKEDGFYLKTAPKGSLKTEASMARYFHRLELGPELCAYESREQDWLLTRRAVGEDCTHPRYLEDPKRLCEATALLLRRLHDLPAESCPISDRTADYIATAQRNHRAGKFDSSLFPGVWGFGTAEEAWTLVAQNAHLLQCDTLLHGDYCLPNVMLDNWKFSAFIDVGNGGIGDRHIDLFWGIWTLYFNLKTDRFTDRFLDAYGREMIEPEMLRLIAAFETFG